MIVWLVETGDYEQRTITGIYDSLEVAIDNIKRPYGPPYKVVWQEPILTEDGAELTGIFSYVANYCGDGPTSWTILKRDVVTSDLPPISHTPNADNATEVISWWNDPVKLRERASDFKNWKPTPLIFQPLCPACNIPFVSTSLRSVILFENGAFQNHQLDVRTCRKCDLTMIY